MTPNQYRKAIDQLELSQVGAAKVLGVDARTSRRWALGEASIPLLVERVLRMMIRLKIPPDELIAR